MDISIREVNEAKEVFNSFDHVLGVTAQPESFILFHEVARAVFKTLNPDVDLTDRVILRYPLLKFQPQRISDLFKHCPIVEDYDISSTTVSNNLIAASPTLDEEGQNESAWSIFIHPERGESDDVLDNLEHVRLAAKIPYTLFEEAMESLFDMLPQSGKGGILTIIEADSRVDRDQISYSSLPYGIPGCTLDPAERQLRILAPPLITMEGIKMHRVTLLEEGELQQLADLVDDVVARLFEQKDAFAAQVKKEKNVIKRLEGYLDLDQPEEALPLVDKIKPHLRDEYRVDILLNFLIQERVEEATLLLSSIDPSSSHFQNALGILYLFFKDYGNEEMANYYYQRVDDTLKIELDDLIRSF